MTFHPCLCKSCIREIFLSSINKNKKYWCFVLPWFSMSVEIEAQQQSSLQWGYKVSWLSICWTWIPHLQNSKVRKTACLGGVARHGDFKIGLFVTIVEHIFGNMLYCPHTCARLCSLTFFSFKIDTSPYALYAFFSFSITVLCTLALVEKLKY